MGVSLTNLGISTRHIKTWGSSRFISPSQCVVHLMSTPVNWFQKCSLIHLIVLFARGTTPTCFLIWEIPGNQDTSRHILHIAFNLALSLRLGVAHAWAGQELCLLVSSSHLVIAFGSPLGFSFAEILDHPSLKSLYRGCSQTVRYIYIYILEELGRYVRLIGSNSAANFRDQKLWNQKRFKAIVTGSRLAVILQFIVIICHYVYTYISIFAYIHIYI